MALIGSFGKLVFEVSGRKVNSFSDLAETAAGRWATHEIINGAPLSEFLGPDLDGLDFNIVFTKMLGVDPDASFEALREAVRAGERFPFILNGKPLSENEWYIESINSTATVCAPRDGAVLWRECSVTAKEYN